MKKITVEQLLQSRVHFGHLTRKWNPAMAPYIFMARKGVHIIDLKQTEKLLDEAAHAVMQIASSGRRILFVATKKQAKGVVEELVQQTNMPYVTERWTGGMLTNFPTIRKAIKKMGSIERMKKDGTYDTLSKREKLQVERQLAKMKRILGSISDMVRMPAAVFVVDVMKEKNAVREANRLGIPVFGIVDTNSNPKGIDYVIPANDDSSESIKLIFSHIIDAVKAGLEQRQLDKEEAAKEKQTKQDKGSETKGDAEKSASEKKNLENSKTVKQEDASGEAVKEADTEKKVTKEKVLKKPVAEKPKDKPAKETKKEEEIEVPQKEEEKTDSTEVDATQEKDAKVDVKPTQGSEKETTKKEATKKEAKSEPVEEESAEKEASKEEEEKK